MLSKVLVLLRENLEMPFAEREGFRNVKVGFELNVFYSQIKFNTEIKIVQILCEN